MFERVLIYTEDGTFLGSSIRRQGAIKLYTQNYWTEQEEPLFQQQLNDLNRNQAIRGVWPDARDPEVQQLLNDPNFYPVELHEIEVIDEDNSYLVWEQVPAVDDSGAALVPLQLVNGENLDEKASVIVHKNILAPVRPSEVLERTQKACAAIAEKRSGA
jgi:hypothetical protein